ncbi:hypothetical protein [Haladaptatus sp. NG-WS-4]
MFQFVPLHGGASAVAPHWLVLIAAVLGLWLVIGIGVALGDKLFERV